ncbi:ADP-ribosylglycohydrolase family protein [Hoyosella sp. G463]|uniref:ADP-ribosylglycohydrolase family protein n=1 Tax=Lolliginicoccus lacisalsi TaxID=2742202 RepID=A0A927J9U7_9ACTN|nr:ADP-ribosylglycohydrolase family protein [Lolliginicoccus lacisalsi]MBD8504990.1 ADP-ribosylglycohydrolase family protein [Lolliginicoccus lacisalsi]
MDPREQWSGNVLDRARGALIGCAFGDALGAGYEFTYPAPSDEIGMIGGGIGPFAPGEWTDDTSMAIAVARAAHSGLDLRAAAGLDAVAAGFLDWLRSEPKDIGNQTARVLHEAGPDAASMARRASAITGLKGGNGSLMRTAAIGLAYLHDPEGCADAAALVSDLTHDDERAREACQIWSSAIRHAVLTGTLDGARAYLDGVAGSTRSYWSPLFDQAETGSPADFASNGWVVHALQTAWWAITTTDAGAPTHAHEAMERAVRAGRDTDTTAAITGMLVGARWGASSLPDDLVAMLHGWPGLTAVDLGDLAEGIVASTR